jgi:hypothetical protein
MELITVGVVLLLLALVVTGVQLGANRCPRHQKIAGVLAWLIAALCSLCGMGLIAKGLSVV